MKQKNFPARKLKRQMVAQKLYPGSPENQTILKAARNIKTKKSRG